MDSPLLSYIDVRHANFLLPSLSVGEAWDLDPRYTIVEDFAPMRDESTEHVSQSRKVHVLVEEQEAPSRTAELEVAKADQGVEMVTKQTMTVDRFLPGIGPSA